MASTYPAIKQTFTNPVGTNTLDSPDHASQHTTENDTLGSIQDAVGTTAGTNMLMHMAAGQFPVRHTGVAATGTLVQTLVGGTLNPTLIGTPTVVGGTLQSVAIGTPATNNYSYFLAVANLSGTMQTFADIDSTNLRGTLTLTGNSKVRISFYGSFVAIGGTPTG